MKAIKQICVVLVMSKAKAEAGQVYDQCKQVVVFHNHLIRFFRDLKAACPEFGRTIAKCVKYYNSKDRAEYIKQVHELMSDHVMAVSKYDEGIFSNDYSQGPLKLLPGLDFKPIFKFINSQEYAEQVDSESLEATKKAIFNHLQSIYINCNLALKQIGQFTQALDKQKQLVLDMMKNLNLNEQLKDKIDKIAEQEQAEDQQNSMLSQLGDLNLDELLGEDNFIVDIAKELMEDLNLGGDGEEPVNAVQQLLANGQERLHEIVFTIVQRIQEKIQSGEITKEQMQSQAAGMMDRLKGVIGDLGLPIEQLMEQMRAQAAGMGGEGGESQTPWIDSAAVMNIFRDQYGQLSAENQERFKEVVPLFEQDMTSWSPEQQQLFDEFVKVSMLPKPGARKPQNKKKARKAGRRK